MHLSLQKKTYVVSDFYKTIVYGIQYGAESFFNANGSLDSRV